MTEQKFSIEEIRKYILSQDSLGDVLYNLKADKRELSFKFIMDR